MADAFARWLETRARAARPHRLRRVGSRGEAARRRRIQTGASCTPGRTAALAAARGRARSPHAGISRRSCHSPTACRSSTSTARAVRSAARATFLRPATPRSRVDSLVAAAASVARSIQPERPAAPDRRRTRSSRPSATWPGRASSRTSASCVEVYESFGVPMPLMYPRATATLVDSATARFLARYDVRVEELQQQDESALNRLLESQIPESVEAAIARRASGRAREAWRAGDRGDAGGRSRRWPAPPDDAVEDGARSASRCTAR